MKMATHYSQKIELYLTITITTTRKKYGGVPINPSNHVKSVRNPCCTNESQSVYSTIHSTISGSIHMCIYIYMRTCMSYKFNILYVLYIYTYYT